MPSNKFQDQTVAEAQKQESEKEEYANYLKRQMLEKQRQHNEEQMRKIQEDKEELARVQ